jgi:antitoxin component YwqK of YwqJK toxin-antitoxin module
MKSFIISAFLLLPILGFSQIKAVIPKDLKPSTSSRMKTVDGSIVISLEEDLYENGQMISSGAHTMTNKKTGFWYYFREDGSLERTIEYNDDGMYNGKLMAYDENNNLTETGSFEKDIPVGTWDTYHPNGKIKMTGKYVNGKREGEWKVYHDNGKLSSTVNFKEDKKEGMEKQYYSSGKIQGELTHLNGEMDGKYTEYYENGKVKMQGVLTAGKQTGNWKMYDEEGNVTRSEDF